ncbi:hypothetical protein GGS20DRAFT_330771 [Poronia punctata]|nr:hypothetical protein GGS20DRAFT_330771 [Poronia punctata]
MPSNGYGAVNGNGSGRAAGAGAGAGAHGDEEQPLLGQARPHKRAWRTNMTTDVSRDWADMMLLVCYVITGLLDTAAISTWGSFVSMQTGNTVYFGLGLAAPYESTRWIKSGTSLACFCLGSVFFSYFHRHFSPKKRWVLCASFIIQLVFIVIAASLFTFGTRSTNPKESIGWPDMVPIALIAFQSAGQAVTSRALKYNALTSVVLTSIYCDLFSDAKLLVADNPERNRRVGAPLLLLIGAVTGGLLSHSSVGSASALWVAAALKLVVILAWFFWPAEKDEA